MSLVRVFVHLLCVFRGMEAVVRVMLGEAPPPFPRFTPPWLHSLTSNIECGHFADNDEEEEKDAAAAKDATAAATATIDGAAAVPGAAATSAAVSTTAAAAGGETRMEEDDASPLPAPIKGDATRHSLARHRGHERATSTSDSSGLGATSTSDGGLDARLPKPRANAFYLPSQEATTLGYLCEGVGRDDMLKEQVPALPALNAIAEAIAVHAAYWPVLKAKRRAILKQAAAAAAKAAAAAAPLGATAAATTTVASSSGGGALGISSTLSNSTSGGSDDDDDERDDDDDDGGTDGSDSEGGGGAADDDEGTFASAPIARHQRSNGSSTGHVHAAPHTHEHGGHTDTVSDAISVAAVAAGIGAVSTASVAGGSCSSSSGAERSFGEHSAKRPRVE